jgi:hypothetical protein
MKLEAKIVLVITGALAAPILVGWCANPLAGTQGALSISPPSLQTQAPGR